MIKQLHYFNFLQDTSRSSHNRGRITRRHYFSTQFIRQYELAAFLFVVFELYWHFEKLNQDEKPFILTKQPATDDLLPHGEISNVKVLLTIKIG